MADNYLENKMEEHRRAAGGALPRRYSPLGQKRGTACFELGEKAVFVAGCATSPEVAKAIVGALGGAGLRVAFVWDDMKAGRALAQTTSTRHYPFAEADCGKARAMFEAECGCIDADILISNDGVTMDYEGAAIRIEARCDAEVFASAVGQLALYLMLPLSRSFGLDSVAVGQDGSTTIVK